MHRFAMVKARLHGEDTHLAQVAPPHPNRISLICDSRWTRRDNGNPAGNADGACGSTCGRAIDDHFPYPYAHDKPCPPNLSLVFQTMGIVAIPNLGSGCPLGGPLGQVYGAKLGKTIFFVPFPSRSKIRISVLEEVRQGKYKRSRRQRAKRNAKMYAFYLC